MGRALALIVTFAVAAAVSSASYAEEPNPAPTLEITQLESEGESRSSLGMGRTPAQENESTDNGRTATELRAPALTQPTPPATRPSAWGRLMIYVNDQQRALQRQLATAVQQIRRGESLTPLITLIMIGFMYGVFHAVGPGHGKVVISSYLVATGTQMRRGVLLAFLASGMQALSAIALVGVLAMLLNVSSRDTAARVQLLELASYGLVIVLGLWMFLAALRGIWRGEAAGCGHSHPHHDAVPGHEHTHDHTHTHAPPESISRFLALIGSIGIRPCSGAVIILLFALAQGIFWAGVGATFAMALGTAATVSAIALLTVVSRRAALRLAGSNSAWQGRIHSALALTGSLAVVAFGIILLSAAWGRPGLL